MTNGGLVGLLLYTAALSAIVAWSAGLLLWPFLSRLRPGRFGDFSSSCWFLIGMVPFLAGLAVGCAAVTSALLKGLGWIPDHCNLHSGHPHLCWNHSGILDPHSALFWGILVGLAGLFLVGVGRVGQSLFSLNRRLNLPKPVRQSLGAYLVVPSQIPAAFVIGLFRPRVFLTSAALKLLSPKERSIVVAHEREHLRRRDPLKLALLRVAAALFPGFARLEEKWKAAVELECDRACLEAGATAEEVSLTILKLARSFGSNSAALSLAYALGTETQLRQRVERLLSDKSSSQMAFRWEIPVLAAVVLTAIGLAKAHHILETVLGVLSR